MKHQLTSQERKKTTFMRAYQPCHEAFMKYCTALAYGQMDVDDLAQDTLLAAFEHFDNIRNKDQLLHYLIKTAKNRAISFWRKNKYKTDLIDVHAERMYSNSLSPEKLLDIQVIYRSLDQLPSKQRNAVILFEVIGFSIKEIAQMQNSTETAIKSRISRGRKKLRRMLEEKAVVPGLILQLNLHSQGTSINDTNLREILSESIRQTLPNIRLEDISDLIDTHIPSPFPSPYGFHPSNLSSFILDITAVGLTLGASIFLLLSETHREPLFPEQGKLSSSFSIPTVEANMLEQHEFQQEDSKMSRTLRNNTDSSARKGTEQQSYAETISNPQSPPPPNIIPKLASFSSYDLQQPPTPSERTSPLGHSTLKSYDSISSFTKVFSTNHLEASSRPYYEKDCVIPVRVQGNVKALKNSLKKMLLNDQLFLEAQDRNRLTFRQGIIWINEQPIPSDLQKAYQDELSRYNISPCPTRLIEITSAYIAIGDIVDHSFKGRVNGSVDLTDLNNIKLPHLEN